MSMIAERVTMGWVHVVVVVACYASLIHASLLPLNDDLDSLPRFRSLGKRQREDSRCGKNFGEAPCASDECCSAEGWCGKGYDYCSAPACQINYGPACDGNIRPQGADTDGAPRPKRGRVPYGEGIYSCTREGAIALTYDDGPYEYTAHLLDLLQSYEVKATFFVTGNNLGKGAINDPSRPWRALVSRMLNDGHQIASHTFSHQRLTELSQPQLRRQMVFNEIAIADILGGRFPTYMRPPYSASDALTDAWLGDLGYHIVYFNLDTEGYLHNDASEIGVSKKIWDDAVEKADPRTVKYLQIEHDIVYQAVYNLTEYMLSSMRRKGIKGVTVGDCLGDPPNNWYRSLGRDGGGDGNDSNDNGDDDDDDDQTQKPRPLPPTKDGRCGPNYGGQTCDGEAGGAICCSGRGWCGSSSDHCGKACQPVYGKCN